MKSPRPALRLALPLAALCLAASCGTLKKFYQLDFVDFPETRVQNLEALHLPSGKHRYSARMMGDSEYMMTQGNRRVAGVHIGKPPTGAPGEPEKTTVRNPAEKCLELLNELLDFESDGKPRLRAIQVSWCARLVDKDPSVLTRQRAVGALGEFGEGLDVQGPRQLALDEPRAGADRVAALLSKLIASYRHARDGTTGLDSVEAPPLDESIAAVQAETYDLDGARRVLYAVASLLQNAPKDQPATLAMEKLVVAMQRLTIELALGRALIDESGLVRGAGAAATVRCGDDLVYAKMMSFLQGEDDPTALYRFLAVVHARGLPERPQALTDREYLAARESWLDALMGIAVQHPESHVRARAMQVLGKVTLGGPDSLREEDWEAWWFERHDLTESPNTSTGPAAGEEPGAGEDDAAGEEPGASENDAAGEDDAASDAAGAEDDGPSADGEGGSDAQPSTDEDSRA